MPAQTDKGSSNPSENTSSTNATTQGGESATAVTSSTTGTGSQRAWYPDDTKTAAEAFTLASAGGQGLHAVGRSGASAEGFMETEQWRKIQEEEKDFYAWLEKQPDPGTKDGASGARAGDSSAGGEKRV